MVMTVEERKEKARVRSAKYYLENKEKVNARIAKYAKKNKEKESARMAKYRAENKAKISARNAKYTANNKGKVNAKTARYRARKFNATIYMTKEDSAKIDELYVIAENATKLFGYMWTVDHITPLMKGGLHKLSNLQVVPGSWNFAKGDKNYDSYWD